MRGNDRGFTLIELVFVMVLVALFSSVAIPSAGNLLGINLRSSTTQIGGYLRSAYEQAVMRQEKIRVRFDLTRNTYWAETYEEPAPVPPLDENTKIEEVQSAFEDRAAQPQLTPEEELAQDQALHKKVDAGSLRTTTLPNGVKFKGVYIASEGRIVDSGAPWVDFTPGGFAPKTIVYLTNKNGSRTYSIVLQPIGGLSRIELGEVRPDDV
ncbi:MAG TPA: prepilin-type N-terminal cleavage/methylation domain-containing protein [Bdellovibrionota bacterium]|nr:prepilin-type N-terminal cleavage/methylation domain-containing protein [Bdellovibrionota bacterium]